MISMKKLVNILIVILFVAFLVFAFGVVNTMVSLKYETDSSNECISAITGINLCDSIKFDKIAALVAFLLAITILCYKMLFMKNKEEPVN